MRYDMVLFAERALLRALLWRAFFFFFLLLPRFMRERRCFRLLMISLRARYFIFRRY